MSIAIKATQLRKVFQGSRGKGEIVAVDDLSLNIKRGEIYGFLGPNGAGKTTTIRILTGLCIPDSGEVTLKGHSADGEGTTVKVGYLPEEHRFYPHLSVRQFLTTMVHISGYDRKTQVEAEVERVTGLLEIAAIVNQKLGRLSKGQRQQVALAQAILGQPDIVFLDEPSSGLDLLGSKRVSSILKTMQQSGITIFLSSHRLAEVELLSDRIGLIKNGSLVLEGPTGDLMAQSKATSLEELFLATYVPEEGE